MQFLMVLLGVVSAAAIWWYRLKMIGTAAGDAARAAGKVRNHVRQRSARRRAADASLSDIDDPVTAAATVLVAMAADEIPLTPKDEAAIEAALLSVATPHEAHGAIEYAKWVNTQLDDPAVVIDLLAPLFKSHLTPQQRSEFLVLIDTVKKGITYSSRYDEWRNRILTRLDKVN
ncbi:MAG TPA: hypothetical protein VMW31_01650 [Devosiaceae bacterium]|nr:hypothetical protein [Devosiaceae bacterium]